MLNIFKAIIFGIVEGITEWLPISSTGHLILVQSFMKFQDLSEGFWDMFEVVIQLGAILAVVILYFKSIWPIKKVTSGEKKLILSKDILKLWGKIIVSCLPAILIVLLGIDDFADEHFYNPTCISIMLIVVGIAFIIIEKMKKREPKVTDINELTYKQAIIIGLFQLIAAILPGTSRSGATIIGALLIGISRTVAAEYTFYLAIPAMAGASLLKILDFGFNFTGAELAVLLTGTIVSLLISMLIIKFLMNYVKKHDFTVFGYYRIALGIVVIALLLMGVIS